MLWLQGQSTMPIQKGKRRNRHRRRAVGFDELDQTPAVPARPQSSTQSKPRRRWELPFWMNLVWGLLLVGFAVLYFVVPARGVPKGTQLLFLVAYFVLAGLFLGKAYRQYRESRGS
jgi:hypothetical protein